MINFTTIYMCQGLFIENAFCSAKNQDALSHNDADNLNFEIFDKS